MPSVHKTNGTTQDWHEDDTPRHPTFVRWRDDKDPAECVWSQV